MPYSYFKIPLRTEYVSVHCDQPLNVLNYLNYLTNTSAPAALLTLNGIHSQTAMRGISMPTDSKQ